MNLATMTELELKALAIATLEHDFLIEREVPGLHLIEKKQVYADFLLRPKAHLLAEGFDDVLVALEVKSNLGKSNGAFKLNAAVWQAASYVQSTFNGARPAFGLVFPNVKTFVEADHFSGSAETDEIIALSVGRNIKHMAQFMNVGFLTLQTPGYLMEIGSQRYYNKKAGKGAANLLKRYVGSF